MTEAVVLDASALLAMLNGEPGGDVVAATIGIGVMSAVNWSEVVQKAGDRGVSAGELGDDVTALGLQILAFDRPDAELAADLHRDRGRGLSLGDRACVATASANGWPVLTADRAWLARDLGIDVRSIR